MRTIMLVAALVAASACDKKEAGDKPAGKPTDKADKPAVDPEARAMDLMGKLAGIYEAAGENCDKLVTDLRTFTAEQRDAMLAHNKWKATLSPEAKAALDQRYASELKLGSKMGTAAQACGDHAGLQAALKDLPME